MIFEEKSLFSKAYDIAQHFTNPVIISSLTFGKKVNSGVGAFIILNDEGWIITVAHLFESNTKYQNDILLYNEHENQIKLINDNKSLNQRSKRRKIEKLHVDKEWIINNSYWWGHDGVTLQDVKIFPENDFAIGRLEPFKPNPLIKYPKIKNPDNLAPGTSLCRLGYPFHQITSTFDDQKNAFVLSENSLPIPVFPIEGILTRFKKLGKTADGNYDKLFIETSSPGLRGQSGGPIFDIDATIYGIQSHTDHLPLGFSPKIKVNNRETEENQFINVGCGVHPEIIIKILNENDIKFNLEN